MRAGLAVDEGDDSVSGNAPDLILVIVRNADDALETLLKSGSAPAGPRVPRIVLIAGGDPAAPARALAMGADEAMPVPSSVGEFVAQLAARIGRTVELPRPGHDARPMTSPLRRRRRPAPRSTSSTAACATSSSGPAATR